MQVTTSREAQLKFGNFSREAQKDVSIVTSYGQPIFVTIPVKITADVAELIQKVSPATTQETANKLGRFFKKLAEEQSNQIAMDEEEAAAFINNNY